MAKKKYVYCPKCGEVVDVALFNCPHCKESLHGAIEVDLDEEKTRKKRSRIEKREQRQKVKMEKRKALFSKYPFMEPLYYIMWVAVVVGLVVIETKLFEINEAAGMAVLWVLFVRFYIWYAPRVIDNIDYFEDIGSWRLGVEIKGVLWGLVFVGLGIILAVAGLIIQLFVDSL